MLNLLIVKLIYLFFVYFETVACDLTLVLQLCVTGVIAVVKADHSIE